jgi:DNA-directed RNA polymerase subunit RPC12/RpoP
MLKEDSLKKPVSTRPAAQPYAAYNCGLCGHVHQLHARDTIRCVMCGFRIMYKMRGNAPIRCSAR